MRLKQQDRRTTVSINYQIAEVLRKEAFKERRSLTKQLDMWLQELIELKKFPNNG